jgi:parvulin-like peptidyl-prolyl isomerase
MRAVGAAGPHDKLKKRNPAMKLVSLFAFVCLGAVWAQTPGGAPPAPTLPDLPDNQVVAIFEDGVKFTYGEFKALYTSLPAEQQRLALQDRHAFMQQLAFIRRVVKMAETDGLDKESPTKEQLEYNRMFILMNAKLTRQLTSMQVEPNEIVNYYNAHKEDYKQVHLRALYLAFGQKQTEDQAKAKGAKLLGQIRGGADFVKLVKENSDDETSRAKDGDFLTLHPGDNVPDAMRTTVFKLSQGEYSELVRQPNGFYIFRADEVTYRPLSQVRDQIFTRLKEDKYKEWLDKENKQVQVQYTNPQFLGLVPANGASK